MVAVALDIVPVCVAVAWTKVASVDEVVVISAVLIVAFLTVTVLTMLIFLSNSVY